MFLNTKFRLFALLLCAFFAVLSISCSDIGNPSSEENKPVFAGNPPVIFSEIYTANTDYKDEFGEKPGWVEFYNPADTAVNLKGYSLTNKANEILWTFGEAVVSPKSYLVVFMSGRNKPDLKPSGDDVDLISNAVGSWDWDDSRYQPPNPSGYSKAQHSFSKNTGISGTLFTKDNRPALDWHVAEIVLKLKGMDKNDVIDISGSNKILLSGYLSKNSQLKIALTQPEIGNEKAWFSIINGSGIKNDLYTIELPFSNTGFPDLKRISGLSFHNNMQGNYGTIEFSFNSIIAQKRQNDVHVSFKLNSSGGQLFLMDSKRQIKDSVDYPKETKDLSFAKDFQNNKWMFAKPTPNFANVNEFYNEESAQIPTNINIPSSGYYENLYFTLPILGENNIIRCDTSGAVPNENSTLKSGSTLNLTKTVVLRCAQFNKNSAYPSESILRTYIIGERLPDLPVVSIAVDPIDMFDSIVGLYSIDFYNRRRELPIQLDFFENGARHIWSNFAALKIHGKTSQQYPKKSVAIGFKGKYGIKKLDYPLFPEHPNLTKFNWFILRNNGGNFGRDYIRDMLMTSLMEGLGIDYQKGRSVIVYFNGKYFGIYNLRERSNKDYFETNYGIDESFLDLISHEYEEVKCGSDTDYQNILQWVENVTMNDENLKQLGERIDLDNYTNYMQSEVYFLNKDWPANNAERWRSNLVSSKWKWLIYDTDCGFGSSEHPRPGIKMLDFITEPNGPAWPNPPYHTLLIRKLLENPNYRNAFINRFSLLLATYYAPARVEARINYLMNAIEKEIPLDQQRWNLDANRMNNGLTVIRNFGKNRPAEMQKEIEEFFGLGNSVDFSLSVRGNGKILVHNLPVLNGNVTFKAYASVPMIIKAIPNGGARFNGWSDGVMDAERMVTAEPAMSLKAEFY